MRFGVEFVGDDFLPDGQDFMLVEGDGFAIVFYRESAVCPALIRDGWAALNAVAPDLLQPAAFRPSEPSSRRFGLSAGAVLVVTEACGPLDMLTLFGVAGTTAG